MIEQLITPPRFSSLKVWNRFRPQREHQRHTRVARYIWVEIRGDVDPSRTCSCKFLNDRLPTGCVPPIHRLDVRDMHVEADGSFEVIVSKDKQEGNWLPLAKDSSMLLVRQTFLDRGICSLQDPGCHKD